MATKKIEEPERAIATAEKKTAKRTKKEKQPLTPEQSVVILACMNEDFLAKLNKLAEKEGVKLVLTSDQVIHDYVDKQFAGEVDESARMTAFLKDERNRKLAFAHANEIFNILTKGKGKLEEATGYVFAKKDLVHATTLSWKAADEMLNTLEVFGFIKRIGKTDFKFYFDRKIICDNIRDEVTLSVESLNLDIQRYKGAVEECSEIENKEKVLSEFKEEIIKNIVF